MRRLRKSPVSCKDKKNEILIVHIIRKFNFKTMTYATGGKKNRTQKNNIK